MTETRRGNAGGLYVKESTMPKGYERRCGCHLQNQKQGDILTFDK